MNILNLKLINIYILKKKVYLKAHKIIISIKIHSYEISIQKIVHTQFIIIISLYIKLLILIYYINNLLN